MLQFSSLNFRWRAGAATLALAALSDPVRGNSQCLTSDAMIGGMRQYFADWDKQLVDGSNKTWTCLEFAQYLYNSRDRIQMTLHATYQNMTNIPHQSAAETLAADGSAGPSATGEVAQPAPPPGFGEIPWIMSHVNTAASVVSASIHVNSGLGVMRGECFKEPQVHLLFFVALRRVHQLMLNQLKYLWYMIQNTPEMYRGASAQWLQEAAAVFRGDLDTTESIFGEWNPPNITVENRTDEDILTYNQWERPGVYTMLDLLRKQTFNENKWDKELIRTLMRFVFNKNDLLIELGAGTGEISVWLNETGWVQSHAYDYSHDIQLITFNNVHQLRQDEAPSLLGDGDVPYDWILCLNVQCPWMLQKVTNVRGMLLKGVIIDKTVKLSTGSGTLVEEVMSIFGEGVLGENEKAKQALKLRGLDDQYTVLTLSAATT